MNEYFIDYKLDLWLKYSDILSDAHDRVNELVMHGYLPDLNKEAINKISGNSLKNSL